MDVLLNHVADIVTNVANSRFLRRALGWFVHVPNDHAESYMMTDTVVYSRGCQVHRHWHGTPLHCCVCLETFESGICAKCLPLAV